MEIRGNRSYRYNDLYWDKAKKYFKTPYEVPHYTEVIRDKVIRDITHDPLWYLNILYKRIRRVISETTPVSLRLGQWGIDLFIHGILVFAVLVFLITAHNWVLLKILCFSFPLSFTAIFLYSGGNTTYYSCYHLFAAAILAAWLLEGGLWWYKKISTR